MRVLVVGKAKTGTTALVSLVRQSLGPCNLVMEPQSILAFGAQSAAEQGNEAIKILYEHFRGRPRHLDAIVHAEFGFPVDKVVFISRDVRDEMISKLLYHGKIARDDGLIPEPRDEVVRQWVAALEAKERDPSSISFRHLCQRFEELYDIHDLWLRITNMAEKRQYETYIHGGVARDCYVLAYEDMVEGRNQGLADYLGVPITDDMDSVDLGQFAYTKRTARAGNWRSFFTQEDVDVLRPLITQMLPGQSYQDWDLVAAPHLDPEEYSRYVARIATP